MSSYAHTPIRDLDDLSTASFVPADAVAALGDRFPGPALAEALVPFHATTCPNCGDIGLFRWDFLGRLTHDCGAAWYVSTWAYLGRQISRSFGWGKAFAIATVSPDDDDSAGAVIAGLFMLLVGFLCGLAIRLPFGLLMTPIQAVVKLASSPSLPDAASLSD